MTAIRTDEVTYSSVELVELGGISYRQLDYWCRTKRLPDNAHGTGSLRTFTGADVQFVRYVKALLDYDLSLDRAMTSARVLAAGSRVVHVAGDVLITMHAIAPEPNDNEPWVPANEGVSA